MKPPPTPSETDIAGEWSWDQVVEEWETVTADLLAVYGPAALQAESWADIRAMVVGLSRRPHESAFMRSKLKE